MRNNDSCENYKVWGWVLLIGSIAWAVYLSLTLVI